MENKRESKREDGNAVAALRAEDQWTLVRKSKREQCTNGRTEQVPQEAKRSASRMSQRKLMPTKTGSNPHGREVLPKRDGEKIIRADAGSGSAVFEQLRKYLRDRAAPEYVMQTVVKLADLAKERRRAVFLNRFSAVARRTKGDAALCREWNDEAPKWQQDLYQGLISTWDVRDAEHHKRITQLMTEWILTDQESQREVEDRLRCFTMKSQEIKGETQPDGKTKSFLDVVQQAQDGRSELSGSSEHERLRMLCVQPAEPVSKLRQRTEDEVRAIVMILNHEIEVPMVPPFLKQSMEQRELACFEDIFMALEYTIHAHLLPGQRFYDNMPTHAVLEQVKAGPEAAPAQAQEIAAFKRDLSRIKLDMTTRTVKVTFKGKQSAARWVGWQLPLAARMLTLVDYEQIRGRSQRTHELVMLDFYSFEVKVRKGSLSSRGLFRILTEGLALKVQELTHATAQTGGIREHHWCVRVEAAACPEVLSSKGYMVAGEVELVVYHNAIHFNWPCRHCLSPEHPTKKCKAPAQDVESVRRANTAVVKGVITATKTTTFSGPERGSMPKTMAQLEAMLRSEGDNVKDALNERQARKGRKTTRSLSPTRGQKQISGARPTLPAEWAPIMRPGCSGSNGTQTRPDHPQHPGAKEEEDVPMRESEDSDARPITEDQRSCAAVDADHDMGSEETAPAAEVTEGHSKVSAEPQKAAATKLRGSPTRDRSPSKKRITGLDTRARSHERPNLQKFIYEYMAAVTGRSPREVAITTITRHQEKNPAPMDESEEDPSREDACSRILPMDPEAEDSECQIIAVTKPTDPGATLSKWLHTLGGTVVNVAANDHCRWLAFYSALYNQSEGVGKPSAEVVIKVNPLKKAVLNEMIANLAEEAKMHPGDMKAEAEASGYWGLDGSHIEGQVCTVANHLAEQRKQSVKAPVQKCFWADPLT